MVMLVTDSFPPVKEVTFPAQQREFTLVKRTPFIGTPLWIVFERDGESDPQQVARFTDFDLALECFDAHRSGPSIPSKKAQRSAAGKRFLTLN
jgi:hypothetical protein